MSNMKCRSIVRIAAVSLLFAIEFSNAALAGSLDCSLKPGLGVPGVGGNVMCLEVYDDAAPQNGFGPVLFVGGDFSNIGGLNTGEVAKWDGKAWSPMGSGTNGSVWKVKGFAPVDGDPLLFVTGNFTTAGGLFLNGKAVWNGQNWQAMPLQFDTAGWAINSMAVFDDGSGPALYFGGLFTQVNGQALPYLVKWDGKNVSAVGGAAGGVNGAVSQLIAGEDENGPALYVRGGFTMAGSTPANKVAKWDGKTWSAFGAGPGEILGDMAVAPDHSLYIIYNHSQIKRWDGSQWVNLPIVATHYALAVHDNGDLYAASNDGLRRWNGASWVRLSETATGNVEILDLDGDGEPSLLVTGGFESYAGSPASHIAELTFPIVPADVNCDHVVNVDDLLVLINNWGPCESPEDCPGDMNGDGQLNVDDLLYLINHWSP